MVTGRWTEVYIHEELRVVDILVTRFICILFNIGSRGYDEGEGVLGKWERVAFQSRLSKSSDDTFLRQFPMSSQSSDNFVFKLPMIALTFWSTGILETSLERQREYIHGKKRITENKKDGTLKRILLDAMRVRCFNDKTNKTKKF